MKQAIRTTCHWQFWGKKKNPTKKPWRHFDCCKIVLYLTNILFWVVEKHQIPVQLLVTPQPGWFERGEGRKPRPPGGRRRYKNPCNCPARDRHVAEQRQGHFRNAGGQRCVYGPRWLRIGVTRSVKPEFYSSFKCAVCTGMINKKLNYKRNRITCFYI